MGFRNPYDGHTLLPSLEQVEKLVGKLPTTATVDRGCKGQIQIKGTQILIPSKQNNKLSSYQKNKLRKAHQKRAALEPVIGHIQQGHRLNRNFYKGVVDDNINIMLATAAFNFKRMMNKWKSFFRFFKFVALTIFSTHFSRFSKEI